MTLKDEPRPSVVDLLERRKEPMGPGEVAPPRCTIHQDTGPVDGCLACARLEAGKEALGDQPVPRAPLGVCAELMSVAVTCLDSELGAEEALEVLDLAGLPSAPVMDDRGVLVGIVTAAELVRLRKRMPGVPVEVEDAMRTDLVALPQRAPVEDAAKLMAARRLDRLPIVDDAGHLVGVVCALDVVSWLAKRL